MSTYSPWPLTPDEHQHAGALIRRLNEGADAATLDESEVSLIRRSLPAHLDYLATAGHALNGRGLLSQVALERLVGAHAAITGELDSGR